MGRKPVVFFFLVFLGAAVLQSLAQALPAGVMAVLCGGLLGLALTAGALVLRKNRRDHQVRTLVEGLDGTNTAATVEALEKFRRRALVKRPLTAVIVQILFRHGAYEPAKKYLKNLKPSKKTAPLLYIKALILQNELRYREAADLTEALMKVADAGELHVTLSSCQFHLGDPEKAENTLFGALAAFPGFFPAYYHLGTLYEALGRAGEAKKYYEFFLEKAQGKVPDPWLEEVRKKLGPLPTASSGPANKSS